MKATHDILRCTVLTGLVSLLLLCLTMTPISAAGKNNTVFPKKTWEMVSPADAGLDAETLDMLAADLGGRGCVIRNGYVVKVWGDQAQKSDWLSSAKPVLSTLLFFAIEEGNVSGVHQRVVDFGWPLEGKDRDIEFFHLANMTSGYRRQEAPGKAWAYNDYAIQIYQMTLFDKVFMTPPEDVLNDPKRLGILGFQDGLSVLNGTRRIAASVRDFGRIAWFWRNRGAWNGRRVLPESYFTRYVCPQTPKNLPLTAPPEWPDYLGIGSYGGGSAHFSDDGPGIYGFNWWFNDTGGKHPNKLTWPDAPRDTIMSIGAGGNNTVIVPSLNLVLVSAQGNWGRFEAGNSDNAFNRHIKLLVNTVKK